MQTIQENPYSDFLKYMMRLAVPIALQNLLMAAFQLIDAAMVARLGDAAMAGVSMAGRWSFILMIALFGINSGASILYSQYLGVQDEDGIRRVYGLAVVHSLGLALLFGIAMALFPRELITVFAGVSHPEEIANGAAFMQIIAFNCIVMSFNLATVSMLRSTEQVRVPLFTSLISVAINTSLNYVLIYGHLGMPKLGVRGAAVSTLISSAVQAVLLVIVLRRRKHHALVRLRDSLAFTKALAFKFYKVAAPVFANEVLWAVGASAYLFVFGNIGGKTDVPAYSLYSSIDQLLFSFVIGMASACGVMVGKAVGAGEEHLAWVHAKRFLGTGVLFAAVLAVLEILLRSPLIDLIQPDDRATGELAKTLLLIGSAGLPLRMMSMLLIVAIFRGGGKPVLGAVLDVGSVWLVGAPAVILAGFVFKLPFLVLFSLIFVEEIVKSGIGIVFFFRRKWMKRLTEVQVPVEEV